ncbi:MAG: uracil-DNA glycosylase [Campylobacterota bacterium]
MTWNDFFKQEKDKEYFKILEQKVNEAYDKTTVFPPKEKIYNAFELTPFEDTTVVLLGQDPYHGVNQAQGLAFSTPSDIKNPPSMKNMLKEINSDLNKESKCEDGDLTPWAKDGVLLINAILTVQEAKAKSHHKMGWEIFTDNLIRFISNYKENVVFILWGTNAIKKEKLIDKQKHFILKGVHPSPLSAYRGFFGCKHFSKTNEILKRLNKKQIDW